MYIERNIYVCISNEASNYLTLQLIYLYSENTMSNLRTTGVKWLSNKGHMFGIVWLCGLLARGQRREQAHIICIKAISFEQQQQKKLPKKVTRRPAGNNQHTVQW